MSKKTHKYVSDKRVDWKAVIKYFFEMVSLFGVGAFFTIIGFYSVQSGVIPGIIAGFFFTMGLVPLMKIFDENTRYKEVELGVYKRGDKEEVEKDES